MNKLTRVPALVVAGVAAFSIAASPLALAEPADLTDAEIASLTFNREEERLARDLYQALSDHYDGARPFSRIVNAEQRRFDEVGVVLENYGIEDPSADAAPGVYADADLQAAYDTWYAKGIVSIEDAYQVGIELETQDIAELTESIASASAADVISTYERLKFGSERHLAAFDRATKGQVGTGQGPANGQGGQRGQGGAMGGPQDGTGMGNRGQNGGVGGARSGPQDGTGPRAGTGDCPNA